jgi:hypothetical protein
MNARDLTDAARALLRRRLAGEWVGVTEENRPAYRELVAAGLMYPVSTFLHGKEGNYRPTDAACESREALSEGSTSSQRKKII